MIRRHEPVQVIVGFAIGVAAMLAVKAWSTRLDRAGTADSGRRSRVAAELGQAGVGAVRALALIAGLSLLIVAGTLCGLVAVRLLPEPLVEVALSFGIAALLFLVTEQLLVEAHEVKETLAATAAFFVGFLAFLVIGMLE